jgi:hypothetical protein
MNAPIRRCPATACGSDAEADRLLVDQINAWTKRQITDAYSFGLISEQTAIELIRENGLVHA